MLKFAQAGWALGVTVDKIIHHIAGMVNVIIMSFHCLESAARMVSAVIMTILNCEAMGQLL